MFVYMLWPLPCYGRYTKPLVARFKCYSRGLDSNIVLLHFTLLRIETSTKICQVFSSVWKWLTAKSEIHVYQLPRQSTWLSVCVYMSTKKYFEGFFKLHPIQYGVLQNKITNFAVCIFKIFSLKLICYLRVLYCGALKRTGGRGFKPHA